MAFLLFSGKGILQNEDSARYWAKKSSEQGNDVGQAMMGALIQYRSPEEPDMKEAIVWYEKSANQGNPVARYQLAVIYENGLGVSKDLEKAKYLYEQAAESKLAMPMESLMKFEAKQKNKFHIQQFKNSPQ